MLSKGTTAATVKSEAISVDTIILTSTYFSHKCLVGLDRDSLYHYQTERSLNQYSSHQKRGDKDCQWQAPPHKLKGLKCSCMHSFWKVSSALQSQKE